MFRWILLSSLAVMSCASSSVPPRSKQDVVWDFHTTGTTDWRPLNDGVMGGQSTGTVIYGDSTMVWQGATSLENNGGFASLRAPWGHLNLSQAREVVLTCRGTGGPFKLTMETSERWWMPYAYASFSPSEEWGEVVLDVSDFGWSQAQMGDLRSVTPSKEWSDILRVGLMKYDGTAQPFELEIKSLRIHQGR